MTIPRCCSLHRQPQTHIPLRLGPLYLGSGGFTGSVIAHALSRTELPAGPQHESEDADATPRSPSQAEPAYKRPADKFKKTIGILLHLLTSARRRKSIRAGMATRLICTYLRTGLLPSD